MNRVSILILVILLWNHSFGQAVSEKHPNIIILLADDLGIGDVAAYGFNNEVKTPSIDAMAANGLRFDRFYAQAPVCSPTRGSY